MTGQPALLDYIDTHPANGEVLGELQADWRAVTEAHPMVFLDSIRRAFLYLHHSTDGSDSRRTGRR